jgi:hypothetical protein
MTSECDQTSSVLCLVFGQIPFFRQKLVHNGVNGLGGFWICMLMCDRFNVRHGWSPRELAYLGGDSALKDFGLHILPASSSVHHSALPFPKHLTSTGDRTKTTTALRTTALVRPLGLRRKAVRVKDKFQLERLPRRCKLSLMMEMLDCLFKADCNEKPDDDRHNVNEEIFPSMHRLVGSMDFEHGTGDLRVRIHFRVCGQSCCWTIGGHRGRFGFSAVGHV